MVSTWPNHCRSPFKSRFAASKRYSVFSVSKEGIEQISSLEQKYYAFKSIPYAEAPITGLDSSGNFVDRRFKAPEPIGRNWTEPLDVHNFRNSCLVSSLFFPIETNRSEDCLSLNVYVPVGGADKKTVLVWIHGGGFTEGEHIDSVYGPDFLLSNDNIVVTIQYRLSIFGFLNLDRSEYSGNMGLKDQQLALKWVYDNIENFSGNRDEILLFGGSAGNSFGDTTICESFSRYMIEIGGASVTFHMLNEESRKYFNRAFAMSGSIFSNFALKEGNHFDRLKECFEIDDEKTLIEYLKTTPSKKLVRCYHQNDWGTGTIEPNWGPTIEIPTAKNAFITQSPYDIYDSDKAPAIDTLFGFNSQEQIAFNPELLSKTDALIPSDLSESKVELPFKDFNAKNYPKGFREAQGKLREAYYTDLNDVDAIQHGNIDLFSDLNFRDSILKNVILQTKANQFWNQTKNTFLFRFGVNEELNVFKRSWRLEHTGSAHAEDLCYIFHCHILDAYKLYDNPLSNRESRSFQVIKRMVDIITNFARTGNPSTIDDTPFVPCVSSKEIYCQEITNDPKSLTTNDITKQFHYDTWRSIEEIYLGLGIDSKLWTNNSRN